MNVCVVLGIFLIAHGSITDVLQGGIHLQLLVNHLASSGTVHTLPCVHVQCFQVLGEASPNITARHGLLSKQVCPHLKWPVDEVGDWLACFGMLLHSPSKPGGQAQDVTGQGDSAVHSFLVLGVVRQKVQHCSSC